MDLTDDDVRAILKLLETSSFGDLELETPEFRLSLHRTDDGEWTRESATLKSARPLAATPLLATTSPLPTAPSHTGLTPALVPANSAALRSDLKDVLTPLPGTFYRSPKPGAPPFVELGAQVGAGTVIAIVETMKLMNSVCAGVAGRVAEICLDDASFAPQDAVLMRIAVDRP
jgi:acetyl-CoA carboxylase biotin carboxyl carrier protein